MKIIADHFIKYSITKSKNKEMLQDIKLDKEFLKLKVNTTEKINASIIPNDYKVDWGTSVENIVSVNDGNVKALNSGCVFVSCGNYQKYALCRVYVYSNNINENIPFYVNGEVKGTIKIKESTVTKEEIKSTDPNLPPSSKFIYTYKMNLTVENKAIIETLLVMPVIYNLNEYNFIYSYETKNNQEEYFANSVKINTLKDISLTFKSEKEYTELFFNLKKFKYNYNKGSGEFPLDKSIGVIIPLKKEY